MDEKFEQISKWYHPSAQAKQVQQYFVQLQLRTYRYMYYTLMCDLRTYVTMH